MEASSGSMLYVVDRVGEVLIFNDAKLRSDFFAPPTPLHQIYFTEVANTCQQDLLEFVSRLLGLTQVVKLALHSGEKG